MSSGTAHHIGLCSASEAALRAAIATALPDVAAGAAAPEWIQLTPAGSPETRDGRPAWQWGDRARLEAIVAASAGAELPIDYDHALDLARPHGQPAPAAGWIQAMEARDTGIWAKVAWTAAGAARVAAREYRFISPVFLFDPGTREVTKILRAGLTNDPALTLTALAHAGVPANPGGPVDETLKALLEAIGLPATTDRAAAIAAAKAMAGSQTAITTATKALATAAGVADTAKPDEVIAAATAKLQAGGAATGGADPSKFVPIGTYLALAGRVQELEKGSAQTAAVQAVDKAVAAGKVLPATRDHFLAMASADLAGFNALMEKTPVLLQPGALLTGTPPAPGTGDKLTAEEKAICTQMGLTEEQFIKAKGA